MPPTPPSQVPPPQPGKSAPAPEPFQPVAALLALILPGLGHIYLGHRTRGICACIGVLGLFFSGLLIAGVSCIDRRENFIWFIGQSLVGPVALGVDQYHQSALKVIDRGVSRPSLPDEARDPQTGEPLKISTGPDGFPKATTRAGKIIAPAYPPYIRSISRVNEMGTLFTTIAGFMNVIVIIDAMFNHRAKRRPKAQALATPDSPRTLIVPTEGSNP